MADQSDKSAELDRLLAESKQLFARVEKYLRDLKKAESTCELINDFFDNKWGDAHRVADEIFEIKTRAEQQREQLDAVKAAADAKLEKINSVKQAVDQQLAATNAVKQAVDQQLGAINSVKDAVDQQLAAINSVKDVADQQLAAINSVKDVADQQSAAIDATNQAADQKLGEINSTQYAAAQQLAKISAAKQTVEELLATVNGLHQRVHEKADDVAEKHKQIADFNAELFGDGEEQGEETPCLKQKFIDFYNENEKKFKQLEDHIESLLPGVTATGLAASFKEAKDENVVSKWLYVGFYGSLLFLVAVYVGLYVYALVWGDGLTWELLLFKTTLGFPLAWIAWYCQRAISEIKRTREEYHHKQRVMQLYVGFVEHIRNLPSEAKVAELAQVVLDTVRKNPAEQMKIDKMESENQMLKKIKKMHEFFNFKDDK